MDSIMHQLAVFNNSIESAYIIGSHQTKYERPDSDIDIVLVLNKNLFPKQVNVFKSKNPGIDLILLSKNSIETEIQKTPSYYLSAINQIKLNPRRIYGSDFIEQYSLCKKKIEINQLHFPFFVIKKILHYNNLKSSLLSTYLDSFDMFKKLNFGSAFSVAGKTYYTYRELSTLLFTLCSYKLVKNNLFYWNKPGKHWFLEDYIQHCKKDNFYTFFQNYQCFLQKMNSNVFDKRSWYLEHPVFKFQVFSLFKQYWQFFTRTTNFNC